jgi:anti-sigma regulatory factor (Ser/Thr protein kinase)
MCELSPTPPLITAAVFRLRAEPESAAAARHLSRPWLGELLPVESPVADDALLVLTELVANAVQHTASAHILCRLSASGDELHVTVEDEGGTLAIPCPRAPSEDAECGRGLLLVDALATAWHVIPVEPEGRAVCATLKIPGESVATAS